MTNDLTTLKSIIDECLETDPLDRTTHQQAIVDLYELVESTCVGMGSYFA